MCGILAAVLIMPTTVRLIGDDRLREFLPALKHAVRSTVDGLDRGAADPQSVPVPCERPELGHVDQALDAFREAARPSTHPLNPWRAERARALRVLEQGLKAVWNAATTSSRWPNSRRAPASTPPPSAHSPRARPCCRSPGAE